MYRSMLATVIAVVVALGVFIWASDRITLEGERTIYTVVCDQGVWEGLRCTGRLKAGDRHRFRASRSRHEIVYWIAGSSSSSGKFTECDVTDRDRWVCKEHAGEQPTITHEMTQGRPMPKEAGSDLPFHAVNKWKWWALDMGIPVVKWADYSSNRNPRLHSPPSPDDATK
jgi:hypothetical protein